MEINVITHGFYERYQLGLLTAFKTSENIDHSKVLTDTIADQDLVPTNNFIV